LFHVEQFGWADGTAYRDKTETWIRADGQNVPRGTISGRGRADPGQREGGAGVIRPDCSTWNNLGGLTELLTGIKGKGIRADGQIVPRGTISGFGRTDSRLREGGSGVNRVKMFPVEHFRQPGPAGAGRLRSVLILSSSLSL